MDLYPCIHCAQVLSSERAWRRHIREMHESPRLACDRPGCGYTTSRPYRMAAHFQIHCAEEIDSLLRRASPHPTSKPVAPAQPTPVEPSQLTPVDGSYPCYSGSYSLRRCTRYTAPIPLEADEDLPDPRICFEEQSPDDDLPALGPYSPVTPVGSPCPDQVPDPMDCGPYSPITPWGSPAASLEEDPLVTSSTEAPDLLLQACQAAGLVPTTPVVEQSEPVARTLFLPRPFPRDAPATEPVFVTSVVLVSTGAPQDRCGTPTLDEWYSQVDPAEYTPVWQHRTSQQDTSV